MTWKDYKKVYLWHGSSFVDSRELRYVKIKINIKTSLINSLEN